MKTKKCSKCKVEKPVDSFVRRKERLCGYRSACKACDKASYAGALKDYRTKHKRPDSSMRWRLKNVYGITQEQREARLEMQRGKCAICKVRFDSSNSKARACVDHDHATGRFRGMLCTTCNRALGLLGDDPVKLLAALKYLMVN